MHFGLIGGIGPAATIVYYDAISRRCIDAGKPLRLTIDNADSRELVANMEAGRADRQAATFAKHVAKLQAAGCEMAAITSMGGHFCIDQLQEISSLPLLSAVPVLDAFLAREGLTKVGVLGTRAVMASGLYGLKLATVLAPEGECLAAVHREYVDISVKGSASPDQVSFFRAHGRRLIDRGAQAIILGGTDLSLAFADDPGYPIVDSAQVHADAIARLAMDQADSVDAAPAPKTLGHDGQSRDG